MGNFENGPKTIEQLEDENRALKLENQELKRRLEEAEKTALTDPLTGLYNRRGLEQSARLILPEKIEGGHREQRGEEERKGNKRVAILHLDIDEFKQINDQYGHAEGDRIIREAAEFLTRAVRKNDAVSRSGGDEFIVILNGANEKIINKFFDRDAEPPRPRFGFDTEIGGEQRRVSFSGGIALNKPGETSDDLGQMIGRADDALYESKAAGRDRVTLFKPSADLPADEA